MEKIKKNWHIIIIILLLIISITSIFLNIKFNKKDIKINAQEEYENIQVTLNEDLSNKEFYFDTNAINNITSEDIQNYYNTFTSRDVQIAVDVAINTTNSEILIYRYRIYLQKNNTIEIEININYNGNLTQVYLAKNNNGIVTTTTNLTEYTQANYITTNAFNNTTTASQFYVNYFNMVSSQFFKFKKEIQTPTPTLSKELNTLIWTSSNNANYELYKDNILLITTNNNRYVAISNGTYKVRTIINNNYSEFSNEIVINDIEEDGQYTFLTLFGNLADSQIYLIQSMLNFEILGFNLYQLFTALLTLCIIIIVCKIALFK